MRNTLLLAALLVAALPSLASAQLANRSVDAPLPAPRTVVVAGGAVVPVAVSRPIASVWRPTSSPVVRIALAQPEPVVAPGTPNPLLDRATIRAHLQGRRALNVQRFRAYAAAGQFPRNHVQQGMLNVLVDEEGHICAAANLIAQDGQLALVSQTARDSNFIRLADVHSGPLYAWILESGFTQEEIAMIQAPYAYIEPELPEEPQQVLIAQETRRLQQRFREIDAALAASENASLELAVDRLLAFRTAQLGG